MFRIVGLQNESKRHKKRESRRKGDFRLICPKSIPSKSRPRPNEEVVVAQPQPVLEEPRGAELPEPVPASKVETVITKSGLEPNVAVHEPAMVPCN